jgi:serine/threonine-protein kinase RsbW
MSSEPMVVELRFPSQLGFEKVAMSAAASAADLMGFSDARVEDLKTAVSEACINAIEHGNQCNRFLDVAVTLSLSETSLDVTIKDHGKGLDEEPAIPDIDRKMLGEESPRGLGMFLIRALVDEVEYVSHESGGQARLVIHLNSVYEEQV